MIVVKKYCQALKETEKALLVRWANGEEQWIPKSVITEDSSVQEENDEGTLIVKKWWADANEIEKDHEGSFISYD